MCTKSDEELDKGTVSDPTDRQPKRNAASRTVVNEPASQRKRPKDLWLGKHRVKCFAINILAWTMQNACSATVGKELSGNGRPGKDQRRTRANSLEAKEKKERKKKKRRKKNKSQNVVCTICLASPYRGSRWSVLRGIDRYCTDVKKKRRPNQTKRK